MDKILKEHFDRFIDKGELPPELRELSEEVTLFDDKELLKVWRNNFRGIQWTDERGNIFRGAVDNVLKKGNKLIVLDYKTRGYAVKEDTHTYYQDQMDIYNLLLRNNGYQTEDYTYLLFYYPNKISESGDVAFHVDVLKIKINVQNAEDIFKKAIDVLEGEMPEPSDECGFCKWIYKCSCEIE